MKRVLKPDDFWAKLKHENDDRSQPVVGWHSLEAHSADVAAVTEALLQRTILNQRLAHLVGWDELPATHVARLSALAAIHDAGKANHGFQNRGFNGIQPRNGHVRPIVEVLPSERSADILTALGVAPMMVEWFSSEDDLWYTLLATFGHHGRPVKPEHNFKWLLWEENEHRAPLQELERLASCIQQWFPEAFDAQAKPFPGTPSLQHAFNGILTLADWIGSDERFFDFAPDATDPMPRARCSASQAVEKLFLDPSALRKTLGPSPIGFAGILENPEWTPHGIQQACLEAPAHPEGSLAVLESDTGSGKTEAALARFVRLYQEGLVDGMYFAVPTRSAATQLHDRVQTTVKRLLPGGDAPPVVQAVPGYIKADAHEATRLPGFKVRWDEEDAMQERGWAAEQPKRYLAGPIVVGTIDQVLLSALEVSHAHMRAAALLRHFLVIDEVHASDVYMTGLTDRVLNQHMAAGGHALLMSATLGSAARVHLTTAGRASPPPPAEAENVDYPLLTHVRSDRLDPTPVHAPSSGTNKSVHPELRPIASDAEAIARLAASRARDGARVLIIRNLVDDCRRTQRALEEVTSEDSRLRFNVAGTAAPHHSRYASSDRQLLDRAIESAFGKNTTQRSIVAVATQTVEQSLDIDADLLITDLCPMDVLLQRIGRLHRHRRDRPTGFETARCIVLVPEARDLTKSITPDGHGWLGPHGLGTVYQDLRTLEATWQVLEDPQAAPWHIPEHNRRLVERATHPDRLSALAHDKGEAWMQHQNQIAGQAFADRMHSDLVGLNPSKPFGENEFGADLAQIKTRLGLDDYRVELPHPVASPFSTHPEASPIDEVKIGEHQVDEMPDELVADDLDVDDDSFSFTFAGQYFMYNRMGLMDGRRN